MKKLLFIAALVLSGVGAFAQAKTEVFALMNNPANTSGSATKPDTTRAATAYYFEAPALNNLKSLIIQCNTKKDSGTVSGYAFIEASIDPTVPGTAKTWFSLVSAAGDSLAIGNGDNSRYWIYTPTSTIRPEFLYYRARVNITAISRSRVKCWVKAKLGS